MACHTISVQTASDTQATYSIVRQYRGSLIACTDAFSGESFSREEEVKQEGSIGGVPVDVFQGPTYKLSASLLDIMLGGDNRTWPRCSNVHK